MKIEYSPAINALYVRLNGGRLNQTVEVEADVYADLDAAGEPVGLEFLDDAAFFPFLARHASTSGVVTIVEVPDQLASILRASTRVLVT
jgi:uncharacterized protein YuzE